MRGCYKLIGLFVILLQMSNVFTIVLNPGKVIEFKDMTKYTGCHVEYLHGFKSMVMNYNAIVKAIIGLGYTIKKLWYQIPGYSLRGGVV